ncbi:MAG: hypothetical protein HZC42_03060 [Candidatus Eisenbacteria bacterium]|nr:hypothetical protein [Candidatus Eisenbacteria bacterium]
MLLALAFAVLLLPQLLRGDGSPGSRRRIRLAGVAVLAVWVALSVAGALLERR